MNLFTAVTELISIFLFTTCFLFIARKVAKRIGLVDKPNFRKRHQGLIPLVGGISVYAGICFTFGIADYYIPHAALYIACADRIGTERGQPFEGQSLILSYTGWPAAGPASRDGEEIVSAEIDLGAARRARNWNDFNQVLRDRRTDVYAEMLGSDISRGWY